jgi:hypothetical protein
VNRKSLLAVSIVAPFLTACGGGDSGELSLAQNASAIANDTQLILDRINLMPGTSSANVPTTGSAVYSGTLAGVVVLPSRIGDPATFLGNVDVTTDFSDNTLTGSARNFVGTSGGVSSELVSYSGTMAISAGDFGGTDRSVVTGTVSGELSSQGDVFAINGAMSGGFYGDNSEALRMITSTTGVIKVNGSAVFGGAELVAER